MNRCQTEDERQHQNCLQVGHETPVSPVGRRGMVSQSVFVVTSPRSHKELPAPPALDTRHRLRHNAAGLRLVKSRLTATGCRPAHILMNSRYTVTAVTLVFAIASVALLAQAPAPSSASFMEEKLEGFRYRALGPYRAGSWIADIAVPDAPAKSHLYTFYVAVRYGGVWKTTNNGTTFQPVFDAQDATGIGCIAVAPSNENVVWVGTGDASSVRVS